MHYALHIFGARLELEAVEVEVEVEANNANGVSRALPVE
jgi:hypothetical protein